MGKEVAAMEAAPSRFRKAMGSLWKTYINIGIAFSVPMIVSYAYAELFFIWHLGLKFFTLDGQAALLVFSTISFAAPIARALFWLPSLLWWLHGGHGSFWEWLATGFYVSVGAQSKSS